jgi:peroxiredoxin
MLTRQLFNLTRKGHRFYSTGTNVLTKPLTLRNVSKEGKITSDQLFGGKKVVVVGLPGAFTPVCTSGHVPGYLKLAKEFKNKGIDKVAIVSVNDHHVMKAWGEQLKVNDTLELIADQDGAFTRQVGQEVDLTEAGLGKRSKRYAMLVDNGIVKKVFVEESPGKLSVSAAEEMLKNL